MCLCVCMRIMCKCEETLNIEEVDQRTCSEDSGVSVLILGQDSCCFLTWVPGGLDGKHLRLFLPLLPYFYRNAGLTGACSSPLDSAWALGIHTHILTLCSK